MSYPFPLSMTLTAPESSKVITDLLRQQTPVSFRAGGPSMNPTIPDGAILHILPPPSRPLKRGSIVLYETCGRLTAHRYVRATHGGRRIYIVADAALSGGVWVAADAVLGVAAWTKIGDRRRRLDTALARGRGLLRYALRPLRRGLHRLLLSHRSHA
ncbi:MAG: S24/S26 family peptidase [Kiritimatiellia bacterium]|nr:hypothetical protein [Lentisphaerota bacterium]